MNFKMKYEITYDYIDNPINRQKLEAPGRTFQVAHDTGNKNSTARNNVNYFNRKYRIIGGERYEVYDENGKPVPFRVASAHSFTDDKEIIVCVPFNEKAWHVLYNTPVDNQLFGCDANDYAIGHELCFFDDLERSVLAYKRFVWLNAYTCFLYNVDPATKLTGHKILDPKRKVDPDQALARIGKTFKDFIKDVINEYKECTTGGNDQMEFKHDYEWKMLEKAIGDCYNEGIFTEWNWVELTRNKELTNSDLGFLNMIAIRKMQEKLNELQTKLK